MQIGAKVMGSVMHSYRSRLILVLLLACSPAAFARGGHRVDPVVKQARTPESDAEFRNKAPPRGSVRLSEEALALVRSFMQEVRRTMPQSDQIAWIGWASEQSSKRPGDAAWTSEGPGWVLGAYGRSQVPPDVIDKVQGIDIVFSADDPSRLIGKTIDVGDRKFVIHD